MSDRSKERLANFLMEELLERLGERDDIREMLGGMSGLPVDELLEQLLNDFAYLLEKRYVDYAQTLQDRSRRETAPPPPKDLSAPPRPTPEPSHDVTPVKEEPSVAPPPVATPAIPPAVQTPAPSAPQTPAPRVPESAETVPPPSAPASPPPEDGVHGVRPVEPSPEEDLSAKPIEESRGIADVPATEFEQGVESPPAAKEDEAELTERERVLFEGITQERLPCEFVEDDVVYLHAVATVRPGEAEEAAPFLLEEKGIGGKEFAFAVDHHGLRFFLSKINTSEISLSKGGLLLLGKQESLQLQEAHENIVNELRAHGTLLPFAPGTVARSRDEFFTRIDEHLDELKSALLELSVTKWWTLTLSVLDGRIAQLVGTVKTTPERDTGPKRRSSASIPAGRTYDIKLLERMLQKEIKIAEAVHEQLETIADRADVDFVIGIGAGSSEDWKSILKASYEIKHGRLPAFYRKVTDLQYQYMLFNLLFSLQGNRGAYSFMEA